MAAQDSLLGEDVDGVHDRDAGGGELSSRRLEFSLWHGGRDRGQC